MAFGWLKKAVRSAGKVAKGATKIVTAPVKLAAKAGRTIGKQLGKVPVVGGGLKGVFDLTLNAPFQVAGHVASGQRLDKVALGALRDHVHSVKAVAPYAQTVISIVPGVGQGISAGIGAGLALASGQPISKALLEGVKSALPGGALSKSLFDATQAVIEGKSISSIALNALPLDANAKKGISVALDVTGRLARGQRVDHALIAQADKALILLPSDARKALTIGTAMGEAQRLQKIASRHISVPALQQLQRGGANLINASPMLASAGSVLKSTGARTGYSVGMGVLAVKNPQPFHVAAIRGRLSADQRAGFDMAVATRSGMVKTRLAAPRNMTPSQQLGYYAIRGVSPGVKSAPAMIKAVQTNPTTSAGAQLAVVQIKTVKPSLWKRIEVYLFGS